MSKTISNPRFFAAVSALFALATLFNLSQDTYTPATRLTVVPSVQETIQSGPAVEPSAAPDTRS
jgi:hypothetical protein